MVPLEAPYPGVYIDTFIFFLRSLCEIIWMNVHYFPNAPRIKYDINGNFFNLIKKMNSESEICVKIGDKRTPFFKNNVGVEVFIPLLFNLYIKASTHSIVY